MSVEAVEGSSDAPALDFNGDYYDYFAEKIHAVATLCIQPFNLAHEKLYTSLWLPLHPGEFGQANSKIQECVHRAVFSAFAIPTVLVTSVFAAIGMGMTKLGNMLHSRSYRYIAGDYKESFSTKPKVFSLSTSMLAGPLPSQHDGSTPARMRFERLVDTIRSNNPDFVFLSDLNRWHSSQMVSALRDRYNHLVMDIGLNPKGLDSGLFIAYRGELASPPVIVPFEEQTKWSNSGFAIVETPNTYYVCTHLEKNPDNEQPSQLQLTQLNQMLSYIDNACQGKRIVLMGCLNFEHETVPYQLLIERGFEDTLPKEMTTSTNALSVRLHNLEEEVIEKSTDYIMVLDQENNKSKLDLQIIPSYLSNEYLHEALSNHHALLAELAKA